MTSLSAFQKDATGHRVVCFGDSITQGHLLPCHLIWTWKLWTMLEAWRPGAFALYNRGIGSDTLAAARTRIDRDVRRFLPATVIIQFGYNDASWPLEQASPNGALPDFIQYLSDLVQIVNEEHGQAIVIANHLPHATFPFPPQGNGNTYQKNYSRHHEAILDLAEKKRVNVIRMDSRFAVHPDHAALLHEDGLHLTALGNQVYAETVFDCLQPLHGPLSGNL